MSNGWIYLHKKIFDWQWYSDNCTRSVFLHLLLSANWEGSWFLGKKIERGQVATGYPSLAETLGLSIQNVRTAFDKLKLTGEITVKSQARFSLVTIINYERYQSVNSQTNSLLTGCSQAANNIIIKNNKDNKTNKGEKEEPPPSQIELNKKLDILSKFLKDSIGIEDFQEPSEVQGRLLVKLRDLSRQITEEQFRWRVSCLVKDVFHLENMSKLEYIYKQIKSFNPEVWKRKLS